MHHNFFRRHLKRTLLGLFGVTLVIGSLAACGHHDRDWGATMSPEQFAQKRDKIVDRIGSRLDLASDQKQRLAVLADKLF